MGYTPNELKAQIDTNTDELEVLTANLREARAKEALVLFLAKIDEVKEKYQAGDITAIQAKYVIEQIKSKPL